MQAHDLGKTGPDDPLCVQKEKDSIILYYIRTGLTVYFQLILRLFMLNISNEELKIILTHAIRVFMSVLLYKAGKDGPFVKLQLRGLSNCIELYCNYW